MLRKRADNERAQQKANEEKAAAELKDFYEKRTARIAAAKQAALGQEDARKEEINHVFTHGTTWQQVAKLVDLQSDNAKIERMKNLIIVLKNEADKKSGKKGGP